MTAAELLPAMRAEGLTLFVTEQGSLRYRGDQTTVARWLPEIRAHKGELVALLTSAANDTHVEPESSIERLERLNGEMRRALDHTRIAADAERIGNDLEARLIDGARTLSETGTRQPYIGPPPPETASRAEVNAWMDLAGETDAQIRREVLENYGFAEPLQVETDEQPEAHTAPKAVCGRCSHWTPDPINPPAGLGRCAVAAPASRRIGSLWPGDGVVHCTRFREAHP